MKDFINIVAIVLGPIVAVAITLWWQGRKEKRDAKHRLFLILMAHRKSNPPTFDLVNGLNLIDVVFAEHRQIVSLWHQYYDLLCQAPINWHLAESKYLDLLSEMARVLGYRDLSQTDISRFYSPIAHGNQAQLSIETQLEFLRVLKNTERFSVEQKNESSSA